MLVKRKEIHSDKLNPSLLLENFNYTIFSVSFVKLTSWRCRLHKMPCVMTLTEWLAHKALIIVRKKCFQRLVPLVEQRHSHLILLVRISNLQTWNRINFTGTYHSFGFSKTRWFWPIKPTSHKVPKKISISYFSFVPYFFTCLSQSTNQQTLVLWLLGPHDYFCPQALFHHYPFIIKTLTGWFQKEKSQALGFRA